MSIKPPLLITKEEIPDDYLPDLSLFRITKNQVKSWEWTWKTIPVYHNGILVNHVRERFQYLLVILISGEQFEFIKDTITNEITLICPSH